MRIEVSSVLSGIGFIKHGFFGRIGGCGSGQFESLNVSLTVGDSVDCVIKNRELVANHFEINQRNLVILNQIHSSTTHIIVDENVDKYTNYSSDEDTDGDAIITNVEDLLIGVGTADCVPVLLCDKKERCVAAVHAGWRGAVSGVVDNVLHGLKDLGCQNVVSVIGPSISTRFFEVGEEFEKFVHRTYLKKQGAQTFFDIRAFVVDRLMSDKIMKDVSKIDVDTFTDKDFFSHRRHVGSKKPGKCGSHFSGIVIKKGV